MEHRNLLRLVETPSEGVSLDRKKQSLMVQILGGLITYLLLAIYCHEQHNEKVSIKRVRELRCKIKNESAEFENVPPDLDCYKMSGEGILYAKT